MMSGNLSKLTGFGLIWSILFFGVLNSAGVASNSTANITTTLIAMVVYGLGLYGAASYFGKADSKVGVKYDVGFWYMIVGLATNLVGAAIWAFGFAHDKIYAQSILGSLAISYALAVVGYLIITPIVHKAVVAKKKR